MRKNILLKGWVIFCFAIFPAYMVLSDPHFWPSRVSAQDAPQATAKPSATPAPVIEEKKAKGVIVEKDALLLLSNLELRMENARLKAEAAIPQSVKDEMKAIGTELDKFWAERGIRREELATKWQGSQGVNGAIILTPAPDKPVETPAPKK